MALGWGRPDSAVQQFFTTSMLPDATPAQAAALNAQRRLSCSGERAAAILNARADLDIRALLPQVSCPTLVLHSEGDAMARGLDNLQIAAHLGLADKTVRNTLSLLYGKLGVEGRPQAIVRAREMGFGRG